MTEWEIWFANFPFEEDNTIVKPRPVIVLDIETLEVLSVKVTSHDIRNSDRFDVPIKKWKEACLKRPSIARVSKTMFLDRDKFIYPIGVLHDDDKKEIYDKYIEYVQSLQDAHD